MKCILIGLPVEVGTDIDGCSSGPAALREAGLASVLEGLGHIVEDRGDLSIGATAASPHTNAAIHHLAEVAAWTRVGAAAAHDASSERLPIFLGGDHSISMGTIGGIARRASEAGQPLFVLWLDAHSDFHTLDSTESGNLHGVPLGYLCGLPGFAGYLPHLSTPLDPCRVCVLGIRSVDVAEREAIASSGIHACDMSTIDRKGVVAPLAAFLDRVKAADGLLHVSLDVDFLDPAIAPAVGTTVPGGATFREAHLVMELLHESGLLSSLDIVELNPTLDTNGRTAALMVDLVASLFGRTVLGRASKAA